MLERFQKVISPHVSDQDVAKFRSVMRNRLSKMYKEKERREKDNETDKKE